MAKAHWRKAYRTGNVLVTIFGKYNFLERSLFLPLTSLEEPKTAVNRKKEGKSSTFPFSFQFQFSQPKKQVEEGGRLKFDAMRSSKYYIYWIGCTEA